MTVKKINLITDFVGTDQLIRCDLLASEFNQQLFRQGRVYDVKLDLDFDEGQTITVWALNPTWILREAWKLAFKHYNKHMKEEMENLRPDQLAKWRDFRIYHGITGAGIVKGINWTLPGTGTLYNPTFTSDGEYIYSDIVDQAGTQWKFTLEVAGAGSWLRIINEYLTTYFAEPNPDDSANDGTPYGELSDANQFANVENLMKDGNYPPYDPAPSYDDRLWVKVGTLGTSGVGVQSLSTGYFEAPLGFVVINGYTQSDVANSTLSLCYKSGNYKGISARSMEDL